GVGKVDNLSTNTVVYGENAISIRGRPIHIHETSIDTKIIEENTSHALVEVTLIDKETNKPISLENRKGSIIVQNKVKSTNSSGKVQFLVKKQQYLKVKYNATPWYDTNHPTVYAPADDYIAVKNTNMYNQSVEYLFKLAIQGGIVIAMMTYLIDMMFPWVDVWPPWRKVF
ncbi:MAG: hypothetical protein ABEI86_06355, partial [Halobacteriaceae archaeon]